ncbi:MAG: hypothetical protein HQK88_08990 [Nitrospirae bacterium]|nr:hypothetical protein [Nitrospirota bacterium]MBF0535631.1 hypothetical protein [Nitrospirota bacterium]MBF0616937.1 hypothetical protein [Nitrospirota bacterium]
MVKRIEEYVKGNFTAPAAIFNPIYILAFLFMLIMAFRLVPIGTDAYSYFTAKRIGYEHNAKENVGAQLPGPGFRGGGGKNYYAAFSGATSTSALYIFKNGFGDGTVTANTGTISWTGPKGILRSQTTGAQITLTATASSQSIFSSWSGCNSLSGNQCTVNFAPSAMVTTNFNESSLGTAAKTVKYQLPFLHSDTNNVVYCFLSNSISTEVNVGFQVTSSAAAPTLGMTSFSSTVGGGITRMIRFNGQSVYLNIGTTDVSINLAQDVGTSNAYGGTLRVVSTTGEDVNCKSVGLSCFQGTTSPKRNIAGYLCVDDSTSGPGGLRNLADF